MSTPGGSGKMVVRQFAAAVGVVLSLVFVGIQIRQNTAAVRSATLQALSDAQRELILSSVLEENHSALVTRVFRGETSEDFTEFENTRLFGWYVVLVAHLQNTYLQREAGVVDDDVFESFGWTSPALQTPHFAEFRERALAAGASPRFAEFFREWMAEHSEASR